jgi:hypothetical protein
VNADQADLDMDGIGDACDDDTDGDGLSNADEEAIKTDPLDPDTDDDNIPDNAEVDDVESPTDTDDDGTIDALDPDSDGDGVIDAVDACPQVAGDAACNGCPRNVCGQCGTDGLVDTNGDGEYDCVDTDDDGDGVIDSLDAFPLDAGETVDTDGDGQGNNADADDDNDTIATVTENAGTTDVDGDGVANYLDLDTDNDGIFDSVEGTTNAFSRPVANYRDVDSDGDSVTDSVSVPAVVPKPTWKLTELVEPSSSLMPLNSVDAPMRLTSLTRLWNSWSSVSLSWLDTEPLLDWIASSRRRVRMLLTSFSAPSAVCTIEMPSFALRFAWSSERI